MSHFTVSRVFDRVDWVDVCGQLNRRCVVIEKMTIITSAYEIVLALSARRWLGARQTHLRGFEIFSMETYAIRVEMWIMRECVSKLHEMRV